MYCNQCGHELSKREKFCTVCGTAVGKVLTTEMTTLPKNVSEYQAEIQEKSSVQLPDKTLKFSNTLRRRAKSGTLIAIAVVLVLVVGALIYANANHQQNNQKDSRLNNNNSIAELIKKVDSDDFDPGNLSDTNLSNNDAEAIAGSIQRGFFLLGNDFVFNDESSYHDNYALFYHALNYYWSQSLSSKSESSSVCVKVNSSASDSNYQWEAQAVDGFLREEYGIEIAHSLNTETFGESFTYQDGYYFGQMDGIGGAADYSVAKIIESKELSKDIIYVSFMLEVYIFEAELGPDEFSFGGTFSGNAILQKNEDSAIFPYRLLKLSVKDNSQPPTKPTPVADTSEPQQDRETLIQSIRDRYSEIQNNLDNCEVEYFGTSADAYYIEGRLVLLHELPCENLDIGYYPEGEFDERWYYDNGEVFFIFLTDANTGEEYRLYFSDGELIRWIDPNGNIYDSDYRWDEMQGFYDYAKKQCDTYAITGEW